MIAPARGFPRSVPNPVMNAFIPIRVPKTPRLGQRLATVDGSNETIVPEKKPYSPANTRIAALEVMAIQQRSKMAVHRPEMKRRVKFPNRSAAKPGQMRPKMDAALRMGRVYEASCGDMPCATA